MGTFKAACDRRIPIGPAGVPAEARHLPAGNRRTTYGGRDRRADFPLSAGRPRPAAAGTQDCCLESGAASDAGTGVRPGEHGGGAIGVKLLTIGRLSGVMEGDAGVDHACKGGGGRIGIRFEL
jgi:hypothetical protein